ncbi:MAG TPA: VWA domain-containing protein [Vicinamibacterales bacterium]|nr:VWA domain-containing protein [Vicinamibacterales bacterium]
MRSKLFVIVALVLCAFAREAGAQQQFQLFASVADATGKSVATLEPADLRVMENGVEAKIVKVEPVNWPVKVQLLLDNGIGLGGGNIQILKDGVTGLINSLPDNLEVTIVTTAPQPRTVVRPTTDKAMMLAGLGLLAPDSGAGRFVESLNEATQRIEKDKSDQFPVIISVATSSGDANVMERDVKNIFARIQKKPTTVHVVLLNSTTGSASGGANQTQVGMAVTEATRGRFENIAAPTRLATLLPEIGKQVAGSVDKMSNQFRLTVERPAGAKGDIGQVGAGARGGLVLRGLSMDGRLPQ